MLHQWNPSAEPLGVSYLDPVSVHVTPVESQCTAPGGSYLDPVSVNVTPVESQRGASRGSYLDPVSVHVTPVESECRAPVVNHKRHFLWKVQFVQQGAEILIVNLDAIVVTGQFA